jgi:hypothetical protein
LSPREHADARDVAIVEHSPGVAAAEERAAERLPPTRARRRDASTWRYVREEVLVD